MRELVSKFLSRTTLVTTSLILAVSSLSAAMPLFFYQKASALGETVINQNNAAAMGWSTADTRSSGHVSYIVDSTSPLPSGALSLKTDSSPVSGQDKAQFMKSFASTPLDLSQVVGNPLSFSTKQISSTNTYGLPSYQMEVLLDGTAAGYTTLVYEPYVSEGIGAVQHNNWQTWNNLNTSGRWWSTRTVGPIAGGPSHANTYTLSQILTDFSGAKVLSVGVNVGSNNPGWNMAVDNLSFDGVTYNFEPAPAEQPTGLHFTQGTNSVACSAVVGSAGVYSTHLTWTIPSGEVASEWRATPTYPNGSHGTPYSWTSGTDVWVGANIGQGYGAAPNDQGLYSYSVQYKGSNGLWSDPAVCGLVYDTVAPVVSVIPVAGNAIHGTTLFNITVDDNNLNPNDNKFVWVDIFGNPDWTHKFGAKVDLSTGAGVFSVDTSTLPDGNYNLRVGNVIDAAGNSSGDTSFANYRIDNNGPTAPVITSPVNEQWFNNSPIRDTWTASSDPSGIGSYQIQYIYENGHTFAGDLCDGINACREVPGAQLFRDHQPGLSEEGAVTIKVRAIDTLGNIGLWSSPIKYHYDHTNPVIEITSPIAGQYLNTRDTGNILTIKGQFVDALHTNYAAMYLIKDGVLVNTNMVYGMHVAGSVLGTFNTHNLNMSDGLYQLNTVATDLAGNSATSDLSFYLDNTKPTVRFSDSTDFPQANGNYNGDFQVKWEASDIAQLKSVDVSLFDTDATHSNHWVTTCYSNSAIGLTADSGTCTVHLPDGLADGRYYVQIGAKDAALNWSVNTIRYVNIDRTPPSVPTNGLPNGTFESTNEFDFTWDASVDDFGGLVTYDYQASQDSSETDGVLDTGVWPSPNRLTSALIHSSGAGDGVWYWQVRSIDEFGNKSDWSQIWSMTIDTQKPGVFINPIIASTYPTVITGTTDDPTASVDVTVGGAPLIVIKTGLTTWSADVPTGLADGTYQVVAIATDAANNYTKVTVPMTINTVVIPATDSSPAVGVTTTTTGTPITTTGTADQGVLGETTTNGNTAETTGDSGVEGVTDSKNKVAAASTAKDGSSNLFGLAWYWWLAILAALAAMWWAIAAYRRRHEEA